MCTQNSTDEPVTMVEAPTSEQAKRRKEQATITDGSAGTVPEQNLELDEDKIEQAHDDVDYVNKMLNGDF